MTVDPAAVVVPPELRPSDGRFGSGPSKVRPEALAALAASGAAYLGTSHRRDGVRSVVGRLRAGLAELLGAPDGYEVVLGVGGATAFWDALAFGLVERRSQHLSFGEFSAKCAAAVAAAPHLEPPEVISSEPGTHPRPVRSDDVDLYALTHNETSTGVQAPVARVGPGIVAVDATSAAGGLPVDLRECDAYYFSLQKGLASDGGLWAAVLSPAAIERIEAIAASGRYVPPSLDLGIALENSRKDQTYNTPGLATVFLAVEQVEWINAHGGLAWSSARCERSSAILYEWAGAHELARPFVTEPAQRSRVVATIDFDERVDAQALSAALRANGIVDTESYRKLGRNQLRIATFPAIEPDDVALLTRAIDHVVGALLERGARP